ncbi:MAG: hypothetical protein Q8P67_07670 [archaeon]|nr:hypothetical protein [archaeon]
MLEQECWCGAHLLPPGPALRAQEKQSHCDWRREVSSYCFPCSQRPKTQKSLGYDRWGMPSWKDFKKQENQRDFLLREKKKKLGGIIFKKSKKPTSAVRRET